MNDHLKEPSMIITCSDLVMLVGAWKKQMAQHGMIGEVREDWFDTEFKKAQRKLAKYRKQIMVN